MIITGMEHFQSVCKRKLVEWYNRNMLPRYQGTAFMRNIHSMETSRNYMRMFIGNSRILVIQKNRKAVIQLSPGSGVMLH